MANELNVWEKAVVEPRRDDSLRAARGGEDRSAFFEIGGERLFTQDVLAGLERGNCHFGVKVWRRRNNDRVDICTLNGWSIIGRRVRTDRLGAGAVHIGDGYKLAIRNPGQRAGAQPPGLPSADNRKPHSTVTISSLGTLEPADEIVGERPPDMGSSLETSQCRAAADRLSGAIDRADINAMELQLAGLRAALSRSRAALSEDRLVQEQTDALRGVIEAVEDSLQELRSAAGREADRLGAAASLLRKLSLGLRLPETAHIC